MSSVRTWLGSGSILAGVGAAMLCGAGAAAADTGGDTGSGQPVAHGTPAVSSGPGRDALRVSKVRPGAALATASKPASRRAAVAAPASRPAESGIASRPASSTRVPGPLAVSAPAAAAVPAAPVVQPAAASTTVSPSSIPVDPAKFAGTYYEQGSVKQFFSIGLVNTKAVYTLKPDGTIRVQNSGNYFFNRGPKSSIVGSAVPVNDINTALNVSFLPVNSAKPPGNYTILANAPDYSWVIVSDPSGRSGYILTRSKTIPAQDYEQLLSQARALGVTGRITPTTQYPA